MKRIFLIRFILLTNQLNSIAILLSHFHSHPNFEALITTNFSTINHLWKTPQASSHQHIHLQQGCVYQLFLSARTYARWHKTKVTKWLFYLGPPSQITPSKLVKCTTISGKRICKFATTLTGKNFRIRRISSQKLDKKDSEECSLIEDQLY